MENDCVFIYYSIIEGEKKQHNQCGLQRLENSLFCLKVFFKTENEYNNNWLARWILKQLNNLYFSTISEPLNVTFTHLV